MDQRLSITNLKICIVQVIEIQSEPYEFWMLTSILSLSLVVEDVELLFFLGGLTGITSVGMLDVIDMQLIPFLVLGLLSFDFMCAIRDL